MTQQDSVNAHERTLQALELRKAGLAYTVIADKLGYATRGAAWAAVMRALKRTLQEPADEVRALEVERLDALYLQMFSRAMKGDYGAVDRCIKISERRAKLLGLDAPVKVAPTSPDGSEEYGAAKDTLLRKLSALADSGGAEGGIGGIDADRSGGADS